MSNHLAFVFPGQGSQSVGMLADCAEQYPIVMETFSEASDVLGYDVWQLAAQGPADKLNQTEFTQPALLAADIALWRVWCAEHEERPCVMAGHSLGEFAAFVAAEALVFGDAIKLVAQRGQFMQAAVPSGEGAMAAIIGMDDQQVAVLCEQAADGEVVTPANYNSVGQIVIAGQRAAVERAVAAAKPAGAKLAKLIPVSVPSHCALMQPAAEQLAASLSEIKLNPPKIPVIQNVDMAVHTTPAEISHCLVEQLVKPVRWVGTIQAMQAQGITDVIECGPGKVLAGLIKRISRELTVRPVVT
ncbi:MAG: [acyl-carrier-protein] S-malonyltransferase [Coxiella sp. (in: Bacteria)]|nr:MAG: [acyl-carrier-protein] S-malonyltransferase [Coxiella sp. (in: g-proteobacteria)]